MKSADEIRVHFLDLLNGALKRLSMYGGGGGGDESMALHLVHTLAIIEDREQEFEAHLDALKERRVFASMGVAGSFQWRTKQRASSAEIASVYAEVAYKMGFLETERILERAEYKLLAKGLRRTCAARDFNIHEVRQEFGEPSWRVGSDTFDACVFLYLSRDLTQGAIAFDFWNKICFEKEPGSAAAFDKVYGLYGDVPVLRNVRIPGKMFKRDFTFTPLGRTMIGKDRK